jgi:exodeoxyribonuclease III
MPPKKASPKAKNSSKREAAPAAAPTAKKAKAAAPKQAKVEKLAFIPRGETQRPSSADGTLKVVSVNVAGLRSVLNQEPKLAALKAVIEKEQPDVFCIQEHKLQEIHLEDAKAGMAAVLPGYSQHWTCSTDPEKKGYSGVAIFVKGGSAAASSNRGKKKTIADFFKKPAKAAAAAAADTPASSAGAGAGPKVIGDVVSGMGDANNADNIATNEGRLLTLELEHLFVINAYVPNSGAALERLIYRTQTWDPAFHAYIASLEQSKPVLLIGDLNVAYGVRDIHNFYVRPEFPEELDAKGHEEQYVGLKQLLKQPGCTPVERDSFRDVILREGEDGQAEGRRIDGLRHLHPTATGVFTYWTQRCGNRPVNKGLRLDYAIVSPALVKPQGVGATGAKLADCFVLDDTEQYPAFTDHAPMGATFSLP